MAKINAPVIDRDVTVFPCAFDDKDVLKIYFYFPAGVIDKRFVFAQLLVEGVSIFDTTYEPFTVWYDNENLIDDSRYYIEIPSSMLTEKRFTINTKIAVALRSFGADKDTGIATKIPGFFNSLQTRVWHRDWSGYDDLRNEVVDAEKEQAINSNVSYISAWSDEVIFTPISTPTFYTYGGLTEAEVSDKYSLTIDAQERTRLSESEINDKKIQTANVYIFKSELFFANSNENDVIYSYEMSLIGHHDGTDTTLLNVGNILLDGYATRVEVEGTDGEAFIDSHWDDTRRSFYHRLSHDFLNAPFLQYELCITYHTQKGYVARHSYFLTPDVSPSDTDNVYTIDENLWLSSLQYEPCPEKGSIHLEIEMQYKDQNQSFSQDGVLIIDRARDFSYPEQSDLIWETIFEAPWLPKLTDATHYTAFAVHDDMTAEPGYLYGYRVRFKYWDNAQQSYVYAVGPENQSPYITEKKRVVLMIEDSFLATRNLTLRVKYNPDVSAYKRNVIDIVTPTLGGAYPFVRRNGAQTYRTFTIGGLISYNGELYEPNPNHWTVDANYHPILNMDKLNRELYEQQGEFYNSLFININGQNAINTKYYDALVNNGIITKDDRRIIYERLFRDMVLDFLYDDQVVLFKSQSEGNIFVRLTNISFTPNKQLGRHIYSFTATATEVMAATSENYCEQFSPQETPEDSLFQNVYLVAGYYDYEQGTLYISGDEQTKIPNSESDYLAPPTWLKNGNQDTGDDEYTSIEVHLETTRPSTKWEV